LIQKALCLMGHTSPTAPKGRIGGRRGDGALNEDDSVRIDSHFRFQLDGDGDTESMDIPLPFCPRSTECDLFVAPSSSSMNRRQFVFLRKFAFSHRDSTAQRLEHLFCCLKYHRKEMVTAARRRRVLRRFNIELSDEMMDHLLLCKDLLFLMATTTAKTGHSVLHRLVDEVQWETTSLRPMLSIFAVRPLLHQMESHNVFGYSSWKIRDDQPDDVLIAHSIYKVEPQPDPHRNAKREENAFTLNHHDNDTQSALSVEFKSNHKVVLRQNGTFNLWMKPIGVQKVEDHFIMIHRFTVNIDMNAHSLFIHHIVPQNGVLRIQNIDAIPHHLRRHILSAKYKLQIDGDPERQHNDAKAVIHRFAALRDFKISIPQSSRRRNGDHSYSLMVSPDGSHCDGDHDEHDDEWVAIKTFYF